MQIYSLDLNSTEPPQLLPGQDPERANMGMATAPDGKSLLIVSRKPSPRPAGKKGAKKKA